ncbi:MAG: hypothetical protein JWP85_2108 [Rhodoglobus sp.]|nr:hypothetical protein [Rhodoglobus sp.]
MRLLGRFVATLVGEFEMRIAEIRTGVALVEAVAADEFETELRVLTVSRDEREGIRRGALELAKLGITADVAVTAVRQFHLREHPVWWRHGT